MSDGARIIARLKEGFGVEDIAAIERIPVKRVRFCVQRLRELGVLKDIYSPQGGDE